MTTKSLTGAYPGGYYISPTYRTLDVARTASIGGTGVTAAPDAFEVIKNQGAIDGPGDAGGYAIVLTGGGQVVNGAAVNRNALISTGVHIEGGAGSVTNFATVGRTGADTDGIVLEDGGRVVNGDAADTHALIAGAEGVILAGRGTIVNYGTIDARLGTAAELAVSGSTFVEEGSGRLIGGLDAAETGDGGISLAKATLELGAAAGAGTIGGLGQAGGIAGFTNIDVDAGAGWHFTGANTITAGATLTNHSGISEAGALINDGLIDDDTGIELADGSQLINVADAVVDLAGNASINQEYSDSGTHVFNDGLIRKTGAGVSHIRGEFSGTGRIVVAAGVLDLAPGFFSVSQINGPVSGQGALELSGGEVALGPNALIRTAALTLLTVNVEVDDNLTYAGQFLDSDGSVVERLTIASGKTLTLTGPASFSNAYAAGPGLLVTRGVTTMARFNLAGDWTNAGVVDAVAGPYSPPDGVTGGLQISSQFGPETLDNTRDGVFDFVSNASISAFNLTRSQLRLVNGGLVEKTAGTGLSKIGIVVDNNGVISAIAGTLDLTKAVVGAGALDVGAGATLEFGGAVAVGQTADFEAGGGVLQLDHLSGFKAAIAGFAAGDTLDLRGLAFAGGETIGYSGGTTSGVLTVTSGAHSVRLALLGQYAAANFSAAADGHGGSDITFVATSAASLAAPAH